CQGSLASGQLARAGAEPRGVGVQPAVGAAVDGRRQVLAGHLVLDRPARVLGRLADLPGDRRCLLLDRLPGRLDARLDGLAGPQLAGASLDLLVALLARLGTEDVASGEAGDERDLAHA